MPIPQKLQEITALQLNGAWGQAEQALLLLLDQHPADPGVHRSMAMLASSTGRNALALKHMETAFALAPDAVELGFQLGCLQAHGGENAQAAVHFQNTVMHSPEHAEGWYFLGITLLRLKRDAEALGALRNAYRLAPTQIRVLQALADLEFNIGYPSDALPLWQQLEKKQPNNIDAHLKTGESLSRLGFNEQAVATYRAALAILPDAGDLWMALAQAEEDCGDRDAAQRAYQQALLLRPDWAFPLSGLLGLQRGKATDDLLQQARRLQQSASLTDAERALIGYELGKAQDGRGEYQQAMESWNDANSARRRLIGQPDLQRLHHLVDRTMQLFGPGLFQRSGSASTDPRPVFIVGMPRSGTTLTEQIIASHPMAHGCGELPDITLIVRNLPVQLQSSLGWPDIALSLTGQAMSASASRYLQAATRHAPPDALRLVDKAPLNFFHLGLVALMFPHARVVWCRRDPRDVAISIYGENFALDERMATDLQSIGHYINAQDRLMRHLQSVLPLQILELNYERLVSDLEPQAKGLIEFMALEWDPRCLDFHRSDRGVQTPSRWQVKQPAHTRSIGRWRNYESHLAPLLEVLKDSNFQGIFTQD